MLHSIKEITYYKLLIYSVTISHIVQYINIYNNMCPAFSYLLYIISDSKLLFDRRMFCFNSLKTIIISVLWIFFLHDVNDINE